MCNGNIGYPKRSCIVKRDGKGNFSVDGVDMSTLSPALYSCIWKLKDYEESGLSPDIVCSLRNLYDSLVEDYDRLKAQLEEMKRKLIELPVRPGDVLYDCRDFFCPDIERPRIKKDKVFGVKIIEDDPKRNGGKHGYLYRTEFAPYRREDFGVTVFLDEKKAKECAERCRNE